MKAKDLCGAALVECRPDESLTAACERMRASDVTAVLVRDGEPLLGILAARDLLRAFADHADPDVVAVDRYMTRTPATIAADAQITEAAAMLSGLGLNHLPVVEGEHVLGMLAARDLLEPNVWPELKRAATIGDEGAGGSPD